ncbi:MAG: DUF4870 domain-containing protein [Actinomycetia bacterium]|nr:DUF4870 domain-containing protein [Actinomycetes bacterium]
MEEEKKDEVAEKSEEKKEKEKEIEVEVRGYKKKSPTVKPKTAAPLCYLGGWVTGLIFFTMEKEDRFVRFHAIQSLLWSVSALMVWLALGVVSLIAGISSQNNPLFRIVFLLLLGAFIIFGIANVVLWIMLMLKASKGEWYKIYILGDKAEDIA